MTVKSAEARPSGRRGGEDRSAASNPRPTERRARPPGPKGEATPAAHSRAPRPAPPPCLAAPEQRGAATRRGSRAAERLAKARHSVRPTPAPQVPHGPAPRPSPGRLSAAGRRKTAVSPAPEGARRGAASSPLGKSPGRNLGAGAPGCSRPPRPALPGAGSPGCGHHGRVSAGQPQADAR